MRAGRSASCWDRYVVCVIFGCVGKLQVKRSSLLANSIHSWANKGPETMKTKTDEMNGIKRMIVSPMAQAGIEWLRCPRCRPCRGKPCDSSHTHHSVFR